MALHPVGNSDGPEHAEFIRLLDEVINELGFSQREVAEACDVSQQSVSRWLSDVSSPQSSRMNRIVATLSEFSAVGRARLERIVVGSDTELSRFLNETGLGEDLGSLMSPSGASQRPTTKYNSEYQRVHNALTRAAMALVRVKVPSGHGASHMAGSVEFQRREQTLESGILTVRVSLERLISYGREQTEDELVRGWFDSKRPGGLSNSATPDRLAKEVSELVDRGVVGELIAQHTKSEFRRSEWEQRIGKTDYSVLMKEIDSDSESSWINAINNDDFRVRLLVLVDLSPSLGLRTFSDNTEEVHRVHSELIQTVVGGVAEATSQLVQPLFHVIQGEFDVDLELFAQRYPDREWEEYDLPPLRRKELQDILVVHSGLEEVKFSHHLSPRILPDIASMSLVRACFELRARIRATISEVADPAGVLTESDQRRLDDVMLRRLDLLTQKVDQLELLEERVKVLEGEVRTMRRSVEMQQAG